MDLSLAALAAELGGRVIGDGERIVRSVATLDTAGPDQISFFSNKKYRDRYLATRAGAVIVSAESAAGERPAGAALVVVDEPYLAFARAATRFHRPPSYPAGVDPRAAVDPSAEVDPTATVLPFAYVGRNVRIGPRTVVHANVSLLDGCVVGADCVIYPGVVMRESCQLGDRNIVQPGAVIGADGFGFAFDAQNLRHYKVPQTGGVQVGADVEIGANTCIDRGAIGDTVIGPGTKIDDLVMIAHNVEVGPLCLFAAQTGIAGSTRLGAGVMTGGQTGIIGHLTVGDRVKTAAKSGIFTDAPAGTTWGGAPAKEQARWLRQEAAVKLLPDLIREVRSLRKRLEALESSED